MTTAIDLRRCQKCGAGMRRGSCFDCARAKLTPRKMARMVAEGAIYSDLFNRMGGPRVRPSDPISTLAAVEILVATREPGEAPSALETLGLLVGLADLAAASDPKGAA